MKTFLSELRGAVLLTILFAVLLCGVYPLVVWAGGRLLFPTKTDGSLVVDSHGVIQGSELIGQPFARPRYFHPRPSAAGSGYDATNSSGTNLGPTSKQLADAIKTTIAAYRAENKLDASTPVPADAVTSSASGLDPDISLANARLQVPRVARARHLAPEKVNALIDSLAQGIDFPSLGAPRVNVLRLNLALDRAFPYGVLGK